MHEGCSLLPHMTKYLHCGFASFLDGNLIWEFLMYSYFPKYSLNFLNFYLKNPQSNSNWNLSAVTKLDLTFFVVILICFVSPFRTSVPTHLPTAFPVVSSDVPPLPDCGEASEISPASPSVCQEGLCHNGGTCHPLSLPTGATSFQCDCPLHFTGRFCEKGNHNYFFLY